MSRFFLDLYNGDGALIDDEGVDANTPSALTVIAFDSIRSIIAEEVRRGKIDLHGRIVIRDETGAEVRSIDFAEAFELLVPESTSS